MSHIDIHNLHFRTSNMQLVRSNLGVEATRRAHIAHAYTPDVAVFTYMRARILSGRQSRRSSFRCVCK